MEELIAKRYVKALASAMDEASLANTAELFAVLSDTFEDKAFSDLINNPDVAPEAKEKMLLSMVENAKSELIDNMMRLLVEKRRISIIPAMAEELRLTLARQTRTYEGRVYSNEKVDKKTLESMAAELSKKMDASISLAFVDSDYDGIKVEVADLGVEIDLSKSRLNAQLVEHILKAI